MTDIFRKHLGFLSKRLDIYQVFLSQQVTYGKPLEVAMDDYEPKITRKRLRWLTISLNILAECKPLFPKQENMPHKFVK